MSHSAQYLPKEVSDPIAVPRRQSPTKPDGLPSWGGSLDTEKAPRRSNERRYAERNPAAGQRLPDFRHVIVDPSDRAYLTAALP
jgi:hypothetical protein